MNTPKLQLFCLQICFYYICVYCHSLFDCIFRGLIMAISTDEWMDSLDITAGFGGVGSSSRYWVLNTHLFTFLQLALSLSLSLSYYLTISSLVYYPLYSRSLSSLFEHLFSFLFISCNARTPILVLLVADCIVARLFGYNITIQYSPHVDHFAMVSKPQCPMLDYCSTYDCCSCVLSSFSA